MLIIAAKIIIIINSFLNEYVENAKIIKTINYSHEQIELRHTASEQVKKKAYLCLIAKIIIRSILYFDQQQLLFDVCGILLEINK
jgi:hypothetical protein